MLGKNFMVVGNKHKVHTICEILKSMFLRDIGNYDYLFTEGKTRQDYWKTNGSKWSSIMIHEDKFNTLTKDWD